MGSFQVKVAQRDRQGLSRAGKARASAVRLLSSAISGAVSISVLIGWAFDIPTLTQILPGLSAMNPMTAVAIFVAAVSMALYKNLGKRVLWASSLFIFLIGFAKLVQLAGLHSLSIDRLLFPSKLNNALGVPPNRMAPNSALCLVFTALAMATSKSRSIKAVSVSQALCCSIIGITFFAIIGYILGTVGLYDIQSFNPMAVHTAFSLLAIAIAIFSTNPETGMMRIVSDSGPAGQLARRVMPLVVVVPVAVELLRLEGEKSGYYGANTGVALQVLGNVCVTFSLLLIIIVSLYRSDILRQCREIAIRRSDEEFRLAEQLGHVGHWRLELQSRDFQCSPELVNISGWSRKTKPTAQDILSLHEPGDAKRQRECIARALRHGADWDEIRRIVRPNGDLRIIRSHGKVERNEDGNITSLFGVFADITESESSREKAESATAAKAAFLANMSHEIRTPLNSIIGFTDLILEDPRLSEIHRKQLRLVKNSGGALLTVVNDILDFSKMEAGKIQLSPRSFDLAHLAQSTVSMVRQSAETKGLTLIANISAKLSQQIWGDDDRIRQILLNLLSNAIKFTHEGEVAITLECQPGPAGPMITFVVADSGIGVSEQDRPNLFRKFTQANSSIARDFGGTGLGLAICRQLVLLMGGQIGYKPREGGGSEFWFEIQLNGVDEVEPAPAPASISKPEAQQILVVEDVAANQELAIAMLSRAGHEVTIAGNGREALSVIQDRDFDLILMDVQMPVMDGVTATKLIRLLPGNARYTPIIALTANILPDQVENFKNAGMNDVVGKPIIYSELKDAIARNMSQAIAITPLESDVRSSPHLAFDDSIYANLVDLISPDRLESHSISLCQAMSSIMRSEGALEELTSAAHRMISQAGMFGFSNLSALCRELEETVRRGAPVGGITTRVRSATMLALVKLTELRSNQLRPLRLKTH